MYILDTNIVSNALSLNRSHNFLRQRILSYPSDVLFISVITIEEIMQGAIAAIQKEKKTSAVIYSYQRFETLWQALQRFQVLPYTPEAEQIYQSLSPRVKRLGTQDCRIAATACAMGYTVVTSNRSDSTTIGIAPVEDWTS
jgi:tRNA(fMet)-specific endonuclease VapC